MSLFLLRRISIDMQLLAPICLLSSSTDIKVFFLSTLKVIALKAHSQQKIILRSDPNLFFDEFCLLN